MMHQERPGATPTGTDPQRYGFRKALETVKAAVPIIDEADLLCGPAGARTGLRRVGDRWVGSCPLPGHEDKTPSFTVYPDDEHFHCYGCGAHGDVLDLHQLAHGYAEKWEAMVSLAEARGVELPGRSERWHRSWDRKNEYREAAYRVLGGVLKRRLYRSLILPFVDLIEDPADREKELQRTWDEWGDAAYWASWARRLVEDFEGHAPIIARQKLEADALLEERKAADGKA